MSKHWADSEGGVHWLKPDGTDQRAKPASFGVIGNGHFIKLAQEPGDTTPWDENFEPEFQKADHNFPAIINWLDGLDRAGPPFERTITERITKLDVGEDQFGQLLECIISLAVRSPMHRQSSVSLAEDMRGTLSERERNRLIGANMRHSQRNAVKQIGARGKAMVIFSRDCQDFRVRPGG